FPYTTLFRSGLAVELADHRLALGPPRLEQLLHPRQALGDIEPGDASGVEGPHRQLRPGLADRLGRDDAHRLTDLHQLAGGEVPAVALRADSIPGLASEDRPHRVPGHPGLLDLLRHGLLDVPAGLDAALRAARRH